MQVGGEAGWQGEVEVAKVLVAVFAAELEAEGGEGVGGGVGGAGFRLGLKGRIRPGQVEPWGPDSRLKIWLVACSAREEFQG